MDRSSADREDLDRVRTEALELLRIHAAYDTKAGEAKNAQETHRLDALGHMVDDAVDRLVATYAAEQLAPHP